ncbi:MAG: alanine--glyoxylate aminotransferase family protein [Ignavibacteriaceae bacterium]|nr:alanine--glyoxylate aminotransferase family protein [Ignavibacteriaceae bacterium]
MTSFIPPKRILMGPGPSNVHPRVLEAMARPTIGHLDPKFIELMDEIKELLKYAFQTKNEVTFAVSGPGSVGMETCLVNLVEPGTKVLVCINGVFGGRMKSIVERCGAEAVVVNMPWGRAVDPQLFEDTLKKNQGINVCSFVHAETSTGARTDIKTLTEIAHQHNCIVIADTVTSLAGIPLLIDEWNIDVSYSGSQKCLSCPPGLSPVTFNERAVEFIRKRKTPVQSWFMDLNLILELLEWKHKKSLSPYCTNKFTVRSSRITIDFKRRRNRKFLEETQSEWRKTSSGIRKDWIESIC